MRTILSFYQQNIALRPDSNCDWNKRQNYRWQRQYKRDVHTLVVSCDWLRCCRYCRHCELNRLLRVHWTAEPATDRSKFRQFQILPGCSGRLIVWRRSIAVEYKHGKIQIKKSWLKWRVSRCPWRGFLLSTTYRIPMYEDQSNRLFVECAAKMPT